MDVFFKKNQTRQEKSKSDTTKGKVLTDEEEKLKFVYVCVCGKQETLSIYLLQVGLFFVDIFVYRRSDRKRKKNFFCATAPLTQVCRNFLDVATGN